MTFVYRHDVLAQLERHGVRPLATTPPELVHEFVSDLYRFELRRLRDRVRSRAIPKDGYRDRVIVLRGRYRLLALKPWQWLQSSDAHGRAGGIV